MMHKSLVKALEKRGHTIEITCDHPSRGSYLCNGPKNKLTWLVQAEYGLAICVHIMGHGEESNPYSDYFPGYFCDTIKETIRCLEQER